MTGGLPVLVVDLGEDVLGRRVPGPTQVGKTYDVETATGLMLREEVTTLPLLR